MGILNWLKSRKKETPAEAARRRMAQDNTADVGHPEQAADPFEEQALPSLDPSAIEDAYTWQSNTKEQRSTEEVKQKIIDNLSQQPTRRNWNKVKYQESVQVEATVNVEESSQVVLEQISFDQVGVGSELKKP